MIMIHWINIAQAGVISEAPRFSQIILNAVQFMLSFVGILAIIMLLVSGMLYFFSIGDYRKLHLVKKASLYSTIGIIIIFSALIVTRLIGGFFQK